jgi:hypothetical protein
MNKQLIRELAITGGIYDCICDPYDKLENGDYYSSVMVDLERFAEKIVRECMTIGFNTVYKVDDDRDAVAVYQNIKEHFGVE